MTKRESTSAQERRWQRERHALLQQIDSDYAMMEPYTGRPTLDPRVRQAMEQVPRHLFVPAVEQSLAYIDHALPIGHGQTISQPYIVALMTDLLATRPDHVVLEVGTGSGYQAAVLSLLVKQIYSIEVVADLASDAAERLKRLGYANVEVRAGDGAQGWPEHAPFDGIIVTAAGPSVPPTLVEQLKPGGRLVIPVGKTYSQDLRVLHKRADGTVDSRSIIPVAFVPLTGGPHPTK